MSPSMRYLIVRALLFIAPFTLLMVAQVWWWLSALVSVAFAFAASIVFFSKLRNEAAADLQRIREGRKREGAGPDDADVEDSLYEEPSADDAAGRADRREPDASADPTDPTRPADPSADLADPTADLADPTADLADPSADLADPTHPADPDASARP